MYTSMVSKAVALGVFSMVTSAALAQSAAAPQDVMFVYILGRRGGLTALDVEGNHVASYRVAANWALAQDGTRVAYQAVEAPEIRVCDLGGGNDRMLFTIPDTLHEACEGLSWSPDGKWIALKTGVWPDEQGWSVFRADSKAGEGVQAIAHTTLYASPFTMWSPSSDAITGAVFRDCPNRESCKSDIVVVDVPTGRVRVLTTVAGQSRYPSSSPDGRTIAFSVHRQRTFFLVDVASKRTSSFEIPGQGTLSLHSWSPNGNRIAFTAKLEGQTRRHVCVCDVDGGNLRAVMPSIANPREYFAPLWSADGKILVFTGDKLLIAHLDTDFVREVEDTGAGLYPLRWCRQWQPRTPVETNRHPFGREH